eukprot:1157283-Pelagomonas_calceolata.AAC.6
MEPKADGHQQVQSNELQNQQQQQQQQSQQNGTTAGATAAAAAAASLLTVPPMQNGGGAPPVRKHHSRPGSLSESPLQTPGANELLQEHGRGVHFGNARGVFCKLA